MRKAGAVLPKLNIVLVEPEIPQNTGNIARTCAVTGASLHLVGPWALPPDDKKLRHAGLDYWHLLDLSFYNSLPDFFEKNTGSFFFFSTKAQRRYCDVRYPEDCYLFFGKESAGLPESLLFQNPERCVRIPMLDEARSLNLANSVAIGGVRGAAAVGLPGALLLGGAAGLRLGGGQGGPAGFGISLRALHTFFKTLW